MVAVEHTCPMHPEVRTSGPGACPKCGMALESVAPVPPATQTEWVCPMHAEIVRSAPGTCPICGMALEPRTASAVEEVNPELVDMSRRFWVSLIPTVPLFLLSMSEMLPGQPVQHALGPPTLNWIQAILATPVVLWGGKPFFERGWASVRTGNLNMFTLITMGTGVAWVYSMVATAMPGLFPAAFRTSEGAWQAPSDPVPWIGLVLLGLAVMMLVEAVRVLAGTGDPPHRSELAPAV